MKFITAKEFFESVPESPQWVAEPWLACGAITELVGKAKSAGKTTLALAMCKAVLHGEEFLGKKTRKSPVLYLTEESSTSFRSALERSGIGSDSNFHILHWKETIQVPWARAVEIARQYAHSVGAKVLVVDTFSQFAGLTGDKENSAGDILLAVQPLQIARDEDLAVLIIRHERKEGGNVGDSGRGSSALSGAVDIILRLHRPEGRQRSDIRQLDAMSRLDGIPPETTIACRNGAFERLGDRDAIAVQRVMGEIVEILASDSSDGYTVEDLVRHTRYGRTTVQEAITLLEAGDLISSTGRGVKGSPLRFVRNSAETRSP